METGGGSTGPSRVTETAVRIFNGSSRSNSDSVFSNITLTDSADNFNLLELRDNNSRSVRVSPAMLRAGAGRWTGLLFDRRTGAQARLTTATNLQWFVLAGNDITITEVYGITKNSTGGAGVTSYAALPSEVINGNIISIVGDGWYKGIGGVWVRSRQIEKEVPLDTIVAGRQISTSATTRTLSESAQTLSLIHI